MKYLKMLGLAAVAAMALMAFLGAGSASATVLCTTANETTGCTMDYAANTEIHATLTTGTTAKLWSDPKGANPIATCTESTVKGTTSTTGSATTTVSGPLDTTVQANGQLTGLSWGGCNQTTKTTTAGELEIHWIEGTANGTVTAKNSVVTVVLSGLSCSYGAQAGLHLGTLTGGTEPHLAISTTVNKVAGSFACPEHAIWEAEYTVTAPHALYVSQS
jgi:hypothetical protein